MKVIEAYKGKIGFALKKFLENKIKHGGEYSPEIRELIENILEFNLRGGKRIRPMILIFAYKCFKDDEESKVIESSIAMELMQAYFLIHDDIIDNADLRRGKPSMHKIYGANDESLGKSIAIIAGDICSSYVYEVILKGDFIDSAKLKAIEWLNWTEQRVNYGQEIDSLPGFNGLSESYVMKIYELKTASYTVMGPVFIGAALASASDKEISQLREYGYKLGTAFQIQDDIIGVYGKVEETGKPNDSDVKEGKKTILITSGAIGCGMQELGLKEKPKDVVMKQVCAGVGQSILMSNYGSMFRRHSVKVAQILLSYSDFANAKTRKNLMNSLNRMLVLGIVPIIKEKDPI